MRLGKLGGKEKIAPVLGRVRLHFTDRDSVAVGILTADCTSRMQADGEIMKHENRFPSVARGISKSLG